MPIHHLVFEGGGTNMLVLFGVLKKLHEREQWNITNIHSIYSTSSGSILGMITLLILNGISWSDMSEYIIKRPWSKAYSITPENLLHIYDKRGVFDETFFNTLFEPIFMAANLPMNITLLELFNRTQISFNISCTHLTDFKNTTLSHTETPSLRLIQAIHMSCALPPLITPVLYNGHFYIDGGLFNNYPLHSCVQCIEEDKHNTILALRYGIPNSIDHFNDDNTIFEFMSNIFYKLITKCQVIHDDIEIQNEIIVDVDGVGVTFESMKRFITDEKSREDMVKYGECTAEPIVLNLT